LFFTSLLSFLGRQDIYKTKQKAVFGQKAAQGHGRRTQQLNLKFLEKIFNRGGY
jgi:hypothetical protein